MSDKNESTIRAVLRDKRDAILCELRSLQDKLAGLEIAIDIVSAEELKRKPMTPTDPAVKATIAPNINALLAEHAAFLSRPSIPPDRLARFAQVSVAVANALRAALDEIEKVKEELEMRQKQVAHFLRHAADKLITDLGMESEPIQILRERAETAEAERDASDAALLWLFDHATAVDGRMTVTHSDAVGAARERARRKG